MKKIIITFLLWSISAFSYAGISPGVAGWEVWLEVTNPNGCEADKEEEIPVFVSALQNDKYEYQGCEYKAAEPITMKCPANKEVYLELGINIGGSEGVPPKKIKTSTCEYHVLSNSSYNYSDNTHFLRSGMYKLTGLPAGMSTAPGYVTDTETFYLDAINQGISNTSGGEKKYFFSRDQLQYIAAELDGVLHDKGGIHYQPFFKSGKRNYKLYNGAYIYDAGKDFLYSNGYKMPYPEDVGQDVVLVRNYWGRQENLLLFHIQMNGGWEQCYDDKPDECPYNKTSYFLQPVFYNETCPDGTEVIDLSQCPNPCENEPQTLSFDADDANDMGYVPMSYCKNSCRYDFSSYKFPFMEGLSWKANATEICDWEEGGPEDNTPLTEAFFGHMEPREIVDELNAGNTTNLQYFMNQAPGSTEGKSYERIGAEIFCADYPGVATDCNFSDTGTSQPGDSGDNTNTGTSGGSSSTGDNSGNSSGGDSGTGQGDGSGSGGSTDGGSADGGQPGTNPDPDTDTDPNPDPDPTPPTDPVQPDPEPEPDPEPDPDPVDSGGVNSGTDPPNTDNPDSTGGGDSPTGNNGDNTDEQSSGGDDDQNTDGSQNGPGDSDDDPGEGDDEDGGLDLGPVTDLLEDIKGLLNIDYSTPDKGEFDEDDAEQEAADAKEDFQDELEKIKDEFSDLLELNEPVGSFDCAVWSFEAFGRTVPLDFCPYEPQLRRIGDGVFWGSLFIAAVIVFGGIRRSS